jgi:ribonuclease D
MERPRVVTTTEEAAALARSLSARPILAVDVESDGMFAYRPGLCTVQITEPGGDVAVVDAMAAAPGVLAELLGETGPIKIVHDVAFDARILAEAGIVLGNVHDTSIAARMLGRLATGLATLLEAELHVLVKKALQHHDWRVRPLEDEHLLYLAADVAHLGPLHDRLWGEVRAHGIEAEVLEETRYRIGTAVAAARAGDPREPWERVKGIERVSGVELAVARRLADVREAAARQRDVPVHRVLPAEALLAIARSRPATAGQLKRMRVPVGTPEGDVLAAALLAAVRDGVTSGEAPARAPRGVRPSADESKARRERETRLTAWRKAQAKARGVDEQVVLPGHCLKDIAALPAAGLAELSAVAGLGAFRVERDGASILAALAGGGA